MPSKALRRMTLWSLLVQLCRQAAQVGRVVELLVLVGALSGVGVEVKVSTRCRLCASGCLGVRSVG